MITLHFFPGNASLAPHLTLNEIGAPFELALVDRTRDAQKGDAYKALNPHGTIPTLVDGTLVLTESAAICMHLGDRFPEAGLAPAAGTRDRALYQQWLIYLTNTIQPELMLYFYPERHVDPPVEPALRARAEAKLGEMFDYVEAQLGAGPYLLGDALTTADLFLFMLGRWGRGLARPPRARPRLGAFLERVAARPAARRTFEREGIAAPLY